MSKGIGRILQFGIGKETTRGTANASADFYIPFTELSIDEKYENVVDDASRGIIEDSMGESRVLNWAEGSVKAPLGDKHFPLVLFAALGSLSTGTSSDSAYPHTITVGQSAQHQALTLFIDDPLGGQDYKHATGMVDSLEINYELNKFLEYTLNVKAKKGATATLTPAATAENRFLPQHLTFKVASTYATLGTGSTMNIKSLKLKIAKNLETDAVLGATDPADFLNKQLVIEGTIEALWQNESDYKTAALAGTNKALRIDLVNTDVTIGASSNPQIRIDLAKVTFTEITRPVTINDMVKQTVAFKAHYSTTDSLMVSILCKNTQASY